MLLTAPAAILRHLNILRTHDIHDADLLSEYLSLSLMFSSADAFHASKDTYEKSLDKHDDVLHGLYICAKYHNEEFKFCEAVNIDVSNTHEQQTQAQNHADMVLHSMSLLKVIFEAISSSSNGVLQQSKLTLKEAFKLEAPFFNKTKDMERGYAF